MVVIDYMGLPVPDDQLRIQSLDVGLNANKLARTPDIQSISIRISRKNNGIQYIKAKKTLNAAPLPCLSLCKI
jgi:hypothetical protein